MSGFNPLSTAGLKRLETERQREKALNLTRRFSDERQALMSILKKSPTIKAMQEWMGEEEISSFTKKKFVVKKPVKEHHDPHPAKPAPGFMDRLLGRSAKIEQDYQDRCAMVDADNAEAERRYDASIAEWEAQWSKHEADQAKTEKAEAARIEDANQKIRDIKKAWQDGDAETVVQYVAAIMRMSDHPPPLAPRVELQYDKTAKLLLIDYWLPLPSDMPTTKTVRYNATSGEFSTTQISQTDAKALYDNMCYQACLRTIRDTFRGDKPKNIDTIVFNGNVTAVNAATGKKSTETIMSILVGRDAIAGIDFKNVDPKACFKSLKGVSASSLSGLAAVVPVIKFNKTDKRFIKAEEVELVEDGSVNLAAMGWEEFEHLVRQVFEREFASRGGEVKITQSSADGGVDAIAFDPDPITGGKIVIQAKRYTRPVGVSAVRDLYGTAQSEGASKGILVTTADFGPDAYKFVQGKPITLLNGGHLLHLLEKHGMRARIDIAQARRELGLSSKISGRAQG
ncbi:restriction system protein [Gemmobacter aquatilis]|uniref:Restriction system protein n=1 Tax=Gemmobacter aquatilis TaxID=933059 RepID=A0A1H8LXN2_9RHOB|nr:restriction endonuclease [Gemmobacter aquatilis]SEO09883.1 restriction system protein [Gemmobacter aquatilis]